MSKKFYDRMLKGTGVQSRPFHSSFAASIMKKFGWEEGKGLGRNEEGRTDCLQIRRREENIGLGHADASETKSEDQWRNWWDGLYNSMAAKLKDSKMTECSDGSSSDSDEEEKTAGRREASENVRIVTCGVSHQTITTKRHRDADSSSEEGSTSADTPISQTETSASASFACFSSRVLAETDDREQGSLDEADERDSNEEPNCRTVKKNDKKKKRRKSGPSSSESLGSSDTVVSLETTKDELELKKQVGKKEKKKRGESNGVEAVGVSADADARHESGPCYSECRSECEDAAFSAELREKKRKKKKHKRDLTEREPPAGDFDGVRVGIQEQDNFSKKKRKKKSRGSS